MNVSQEYDYTLAASADPDDDNITITIKLNECIIFAEIVNEKIIFQPQYNNAGNYTI